MIASILACALLAAPALAADGSRMRRPRGDRPEDPPRMRGMRGERGERPMDPPRMRGMRGERGERPMDPPRMRDDGMYGGDGDGGVYGEDMDMDMDMECDTTILEVGAAIPELSTLGVAVEAAGATEALMDTSADLTVLAPNNDAFAAIDEEMLTALLNAPEMLAPILQLHAFEGGVLSTELTDGMVVTTLSGDDLTIGVSDAGVTFTSPAGVVANVVQADIVVCSSVLHVIDAVLLP